MTKVKHNDFKFRLLAFAMFVILFTPSVIAQDSARFRTTFVSLSYLQIKESENYGLVFRGPSIDAGMNWTFPHHQNAWLYEFKIGLGAPFSKGIIAMHINVKPLEMAYAWKIPVQNVGLRIGPALKMEYNFQYYPDLQSGYYFWLTNYNAGVSAFAIVKLKNAILKMRAFNNLFGFVSRGEIWEDPYFFDRKFSDIMADLHSDFEFVTPGTFNNTFFEIMYRKSSTSRLALSYVFDYFVYSDKPEIKFLNQSLRLTFIPRMKNEN